MLEAAVYTLCGLRDEGSLFIKLGGVSAPTDITCLKITGTEEEGDLEHMIGSSSAGFHISLKIHNSLRVRRRNVAGPR